MANSDPMGLQGAYGLKGMDESLEKLLARRVAETVRRNALQQQQITNARADRAMGVQEGYLNNARTSAEYARTRDEQTDEAERARQAELLAFVGTLPEHVRPAAQARQFGINLSPSDLQTPVDPEEKRQRDLQDFADRARITARFRPIGQSTTARQWVTRNGQPVRVAEGEIRPGDTPYAGARDGLRNVTTGDVGRLSELDTSLDDIQVLRDTVLPVDPETGERELVGATGTQAKVGAMLPNFVTEATGFGTDAKQRQAVIDRVKQVIGKALEGGVLRKEDEYKYEKILPTIGDPADVVETKLAGLESAITLRRQRQLEALEDGGYDAGAFRARTRNPNNSGGGSRGAGAGPGGPAIGERRTINGQLGEWDGRGWKPVGGGE